MKFRKSMLGLLTLAAFCCLKCKDDSPAVDDTPAETGTFHFGSDLSFVNQVLDHNGVYKDQGEVRSPYKIFKDHGNTLVRVRLWHNPVWTKDVYGANGTQLYNDILDVEKSIRLSKEQGQSVLLDFHYSDTWADPQNQKIPVAWQNIRDLNVLKDSIYNYTAKTLRYLNGKGLMPDFVQIGNETNCGMLYTDAPSDFPACNVCDNNWQNLGAVINSAIRAVNDVSATSTIKTKIILHVADPKNVTWWFDNMTTQGGVTGFDIVGFSYYPLWHTTIGVSSLGSTVAGFKAKYKKDVMMLETAYPWTTQGNDAYNNQFGAQTPITGYPFTKEGQLAILKAMTQQLKTGGASGIIYWEPAWISSDLKDLWGTGSSWENNAYFDFSGNTLPAFDFMTATYK